MKLHPEQMPDEGQEWESLRQAMIAGNARLPDPSPLILQRALERVSYLSALNGHLPAVQANGWREHPLAGVLLLLRRQAGLVRQGIWAASLIVLALGVILTFLFPGTGVNSSLLALAAPLVAAGGIALVYGPENDPATELELATPVSPALILLARLVLVYGYDLALAVLASVALWLAPGHLMLSQLVLAWLAPMLFLSALALALSVIVNSQMAMLIAFSLWGLHLVTQLRGPGAFPDVAAFTDALWSNQTLLYLLAALCFVLAFIRATRQEQRYA
jgi:hypothetical protein